MDAERLDRRGGQELAGRRVPAVAAMLFLLLGCRPEGPVITGAPATAPAGPEVAVASVVAGRTGDREWAALSSDGIRDPDAPGLALLQDPEDALSVLPPGVGGNQVDWVTALRDGQITPRTHVQPGTQIRVLDLDILMTRTAGMQAVLFPHRAHTEWLDCSNCHDRLFKRKTGATEISMYRILQGELCGQCHGAVSFPLTHCERCHSVAPDSLAQLRQRVPAR